MHLSKVATTREPGIIRLSLRRLLLILATFYTYRYVIQSRAKLIELLKGVLDGARRSDRSGEWESVETSEEHESTLKFQQEMALYCEVIDQLQI